MDDSHDDTPSYQQLLLSKKKELEKEFDLYMRKNEEIKPKHSNKPIKDNIKLKNLINVISKENSKKEVVVKQLIKKRDINDQMNQSQISSGYQTKSRFGGRSKILNQWPKNNESSFYQTTSRFMQSSYLPQSIKYDPDVLQERIEEIKEQISGVFELANEQKWESETLNLMYLRLSSDILIFTKRNEDLNQEEHMISQQVAKCTGINKSIEFMGISANNKLAIAQKNRNYLEEQGQEAVEHVQKTLEQERQEIEEMKMDMAHKVIEKEELISKNRHLQLEIFNLEQDELYFEKHSSKKEVKNNDSILDAFRQLDGYAELYKTNMQPIEKLRVLSMDEFHEKYSCGGLPSLAYRIVSIYNKKRGSLEEKNSSIEQRELLNNILRKKKILNPLLRELQDLVPPEELDSIIHQFGIYKSRNESLSTQLPNSKTHRNVSDLGLIEEECEDDLEFHILATARHSWDLSLIKETNLINISYYLQNFLTRFVGLARRIAKVCEDAYGYEHFSVRELRVCINQCETGVDQIKSNLDMTEQLMFEDDSSQDTDAPFNFKALTKNFDDFMTPNQLSMVNECMRYDKIISFNCSLGQFYSLLEPFKEFGFDDDNVIHFLETLKVEGFCNFKEKLSIIFKLISTFLKTFRSHIKDHIYTHKNEKQPDMSKFEKFPAYPQSKLEKHNEHSLSGIGNQYKKSETCFSEKSEVHNMNSRSEKKMMMWMNMDDQHSSSDELKESQQSLINDTDFTSDKNKTREQEILEMKSRLTAAQSRMNYLANQGYQVRGKTSGGESRKQSNPGKAKKLEPVKEEFSKTFTGSRFPKPISKKSNYRIRKQSAATEATVRQHKIGKKGYIDEEHSPYQPGPSWGIVPKEKRAKSKISRGKY